MIRALRVNNRNEKVSRKKHFKPSADIGSVTIKDLVFC